MVCKCIHMHMRTVYLESVLPRFGAIEADDNIVHRMCNIHNVCKMQCAFGFAIKLHILYYIYIVVSAHSLSIHHNTHAGFFSVCTHFQFIWTNSHFACIFLRSAKSTTAIIFMLLQWNSYENLRTRRFVNASATTETMVTKFPKLHTHAANKLKSISFVWNFSFETIRKLNFCKTSKT